MAAQRNNAPATEDAGPDPGSGGTPELLAAETYNQAYSSPWSRGFWWARETGAAGTPPTLSDAGWKFELLVGWDDSPQRTEYQVPAFGRLPVNSYGQDEISHHEEPTLHVYWNERGLAETVVAYLLGDKANTGTAEVVGASAPHTHTLTPGLKSTRMNTLALIKDTAALTGNPGEQYAYGTAQSITINLPATDTPIICDIPIMSTWLTQVALPSAATTVQGIGSRLRGNQGVFHLKANGGATDYPAKILSGTITIMREASEPLYAISTNSKDPFDFIPGRLGFSASLTMLYDGMSSGTMYYDFLNDLASGTTANPNTITYADDTGYGFAFTFWPAKWAIPTWDVSGNSTKFTAVLNAYQDPATRSAFTLLQTVVLTNGDNVALLPS